MRLRNLWTPLALAALAAGCTDGADPSGVAGPAPDGPSAYLTGTTSRVEVSCPGLIAVGSLWSCSAQGYDAYGNQTSSSAYGWSSSDPYSLYVYGSGTLDARHPGLFWVYATVDGVQGSTMVQVYEPNRVVTTVTVSPSSATVYLGDTRALTATAYDQHGDPMSVSFAWSSSNTSVATVSSSGVVSGVGLGTATVTASAGGKSASAAVTVAKEPLSASISGPTMLGYRQIGTWTAVVSGGSSPYTYRWYKNGVLVGTGSSYSAGASGDFDLRLDVTDADGATDGALRRVHVTNCDPYVKKC